MKILVTGVCGFIGFNLANFLLKKNYKIYGIDNINNYYSVKLKNDRLTILKKNKNFTFSKADIKNHKKLKNIFNKIKFDIVIHLAAQAGVRYSIKEPRKYIENNIDGFFNVIDLCRNNNIKKIIYASSSSVYGDNKNFPLKENQALKPKNLYASTKANNEETAEIFSRFYGLNIIGLRFFTVYGEWGRPDMLMMKYLKSNLNKNKKFYLYNYGNHFRDFTYIQDVNNIISRLIKKKFANHQIFNICSNKPIKITNIIKTINELTGVKCKIFKTSLQKADILKTHGDNMKIRKYLNYNRFYNIKNGIFNLVNWHKSYNKK
jgi:UDP-glucuronate 4-epimerase